MLNLAISSCFQALHDREQELAYPQQLEKTHHVHVRKTLANL